MRTTLINKKSVSNFCRRTVLCALALVAGLLFAPRLEAKMFETTLYGFGESSVNGIYPVGELLTGSDGNFYGTTEDGGAYGAGTVFKMAADGATTILHSFGASTDGWFPSSGLIQDGYGNFYGATNAGGAYSCGSVFAIMPGMLNVSVNNPDWGGTNMTGTSNLILGLSCEVTATAADGCQFCGWAVAASGSAVSWVTDNPLFFTMQPGFSLTVVFSGPAPTRGAAPLMGFGPLSTNIVKKPKNQRRLDNVFQSRPATDNRLFYSLFLNYILSIH